jgi:hypothetical protein
VKAGRKARGTQAAETRRVPVISRAFVPRIAAIRPSVRTTPSPISIDHPLSRSLVILIPLFYNSDADGGRRPVEARKLEQTELEIRQRFSGYSKSRIEGWYRSERTGEEFNDELIRFQIDGALDGAVMEFLRRWKAVLEDRFEQEAIYMTLSGPFIAL